MLRRFAVVLTALVFMVALPIGALSQTGSPPKSQTVVAQQTKVMAKKKVKKPAAQRVRKKPSKKTR